MKILLIHQHYFPEMSGTARRARELSENFVNQGHHVSVVTSFPRKFRSMPGINCSKDEVFNGVRVYRVKNIFEVKKNVLFRLFSYLFFIIQSLKLALKLADNVDIVISIAPISSGILGSFVQLIKKKHHHFDVPDILPDLGISAGMIKNKLIIKFLYKLEIWVYDHSNTISAITYGQIDNIHKKGVAQEKLSYIPDWIDNLFFKKNVSKYKSEVNSNFNFQGKKLISFIGNIGALQNPDIFLDLMVLLAEENHHDLQFLFIGDGIMLPHLKVKAKKLQLNNVTFVGRVKREYIPAYMNLSDVLVANYLPNDYMEICIPGKLFEYAISEKPIVMGARGEAKNLIDKYSLGLTVAPSDVNEFKKAIIQITNGSYNYKPKTDKFIQDFSLRKIAGLYNNIFQKVN
jgi:glycosyltransferase involved in cell wall biosynthesis